MKIQQLVILRKEILDYISDCSIDTVRQTHGIHHMRETTARDTVFSEKLSRVLDHYQQLTDMHNSIVDSLNSMVSDIELEIDAVINHHSIQKNLQVFSEDQQYLLENQINSISDELYQQIFSTVSKHVDWHYPGLIINAKHKKWIDCLIAMDPLYLTIAKIKEDENSIETYGVADYYNRPLSRGYLFAEQLLKNHLTNVISSYSSVYQNRLRLYPIINKDYNNLPRDSFGLILAMETFDNLNQLEVERYLRSCFGLLKRGGTMIFNYVNCDIPTMADMFDQGRVPYCSTRLIKKLVEDIGYTLLETSDYQVGTNKADGYLSLAVIKKPGSLTTVKASQSLGRIVEK